MPILNSLSEMQHSLREASGSKRAARTFPVCTNPGCTSGWLQLWRKRRVPVVEGEWSCSQSCTQARIEELLRREQLGVHVTSAHRHRIPLGLVLLTQGWITHKHLKKALEVQQQKPGRRIGELLIANHGLDETRLTQALGLQWNCPVFSLQRHENLPATLIPRFLSQSLGFVPIKINSSGVLYVAFEDRINHSLALAIERITGFRVECGLLSGSEFAQAMERLNQSRFIRARMIEASSISLLAEAFTRHIEKARPAQTRVVRVHDLYWLRLWRKPENNMISINDGQFEDVIGSLTQFT